MFAKMCIKVVAFSVPSIISSFETPIVVWAKRKNLVYVLFGRPFKHVDNQALASYIE